jgi:phosphatidylethanolamine N-methyltransferase
VFGWFFGDFFIENYPSQLDYTVRDVWGFVLLEYCANLRSKQGIYRFLNNPEGTMSGAAFYGLSLISGSKLVFALAVFSQLSHWWFLGAVEK